MSAKNSSLISGHSLSVARGQVTEWANQRASSWRNWPMRGAHTKWYEAIIIPGFVALRWREMECYHNYLHRAARPIENNLHKARDVTEESSDNYGHNHANVSPGTIGK